VIYLYLDKNLNLPVQFDVYDWSNKMVGTYVFSDIKVNIGLKDYDFDIKNKDYNF
jgi:outer membrane lipoprotein-sorting protein